jgi:hypothetical protein
MTLNDHNLTLIFAAATAVAFVLTIVGADLGASGNTIITALCAVATLGAMTFTALITARRSD